MRIQLVCLEIHSWRGSIGGEHYYGKLVCDDYGDHKEVEMKRTIEDQKEVDYLNKKDGATDGFHRWNVGSETVRFSSTKAIEDKAVLIWRRHFPKHHALVVGMCAVADPRRPIDGKPGILKKLQSFWERAEATGGYEGDEKAMNKVHQEYWSWIIGKKRKPARRKA